MITQSEFVWTNKTCISEILTIIPSRSGILRVFQSPLLTHMPSTYWRRKPSVSKDDFEQVIFTPSSSSLLSQLKQLVRTWTDCGPAQSEPALPADDSSAQRVTAVSWGNLSPTAIHRRDTQTGLLHSASLPLGTKVAQNRQFFSWSIVTVASQCST